ncbi:MAG TPA: CDP-alcohol phosphatidyltransferase family protein [Desulfobacterales bacterium]
MMKKAIPNLLSGFRLIAAPFLLGFAWTGHKYWFLGTLAASLLSDAVDGFVSRRLYYTSDLGTRLDSWGDMATYLTVPLCAWWLWPELLQKEIFFVGMVVAAYLIPITAGLLKFHRLPSYHTWAAKIAAVVMSVAVLVWFTTEEPGLFRFAAVLQSIVACEEVLITWHLAALQGNVKSLWHVKRIQGK